MIPVPRSAANVDGFVLNVLLSDGRYSRLFRRATRSSGGRGAEVPQAAGRRRHPYRAAFVREAWVGTRVTSPWVAQ